VQGKFIAFEGLDGTGKSTVLARVADRLRAAGVDLVTTREPGGTDAGAAIRALILNGELPLAPRTELLLMCADRAQHVETVIQPALASGKMVLSDRFEASTRAYQGSGLGLPAEEIAGAVAIATGGLRPDLYVLLDLDPDIASARRHGDAGAVNALDGRAHEFRLAVRNAYLHMAASEPGWVVIDASREVSAVAEAAIAQIERILAQPSGVR
jgi:dTMP kinase